jgi:hypothetical protein
MTKHCRKSIFDRLLPLSFVAVALLALFGIAQARSYGDASRPYGDSSGGAAPPGAVALTGNYTATAADCGTTFTNAGAGVTPTLTLPASPQMNCVIEAYMYNGGFGMVIQNQSGEFIQFGGSSTVSGGNLTYGAVLGSSVTLKKVISNRWGTTANEGAATVN